MNSSGSSTSSRITAQKTPMIGSAGNDRERISRRPRHERRRGTAHDAANKRDEVEAHQHRDAEDVAADGRTLVTGHVNLPYHYVKRALHSAGAGCQASFTIKIGELDLSVGLKRLPRCTRCWCHVEDVQDRPSRWLRARSAPRDRPRPMSPRRSGRAWPRPRWRRGSMASCAISTGRSRAIPTSRWSPSRDEKDALELVRHDFAHVLAEAVQKLYPGHADHLRPGDRRRLLLRLRARRRAAGMFTDEDLPRSRRRCAASSPPTSRWSARNGAARTSAPFSNAAANASRPSG